MADLTPEFIAEQIGYLKTDHEFYIVYDEEFGGREDDLPELRRLLRQAAKAEGMRVHTRVYEYDAVWVYDPDWNPTDEERAELERERFANAVQHEDVEAPAAPARRHLSIVD